MDIKPIISKKISKTKVIIGLVIIIITISTYIIRNTNNKSGYVFDKVKKTSISEVVSESGSIISDGNTEIYSPTNGVIQEIYISNGEEVKTNHKLFKVVSSATEEEKQTAKANYLSAKATLDIDNANLYSLQSAMFTAWDKQHNLAIDSKYETAANRALPEYAIADTAWLASEAAYKSQQGVISKDKAALSSAYIKYLSTLTSVVSSPISGIVDNLSYSVGKSVNIKDPLLNSTKPVLIIKNSNNLEAMISVGQTNIAKLDIGQQVIIKPDAYKDKEYKGTISRIDSIGKNIDGVITYNVYATIDYDRYLRSGMTFDSDITTKSVENILAVPNSSIIMEKGVKNIRIFENKSVKNIPVTTGVKGQTHTEIISGIKEGQEIIVGLTNEKAARPGFLGL